MILRTGTLNVPVKLTFVRSKSKKRGTPNYLLWFKSYGGGLIAGIILLVISLMVFFAPLVTPHDPTAGMNLQNRFIPPVWIEGGTAIHPLGTDNLGRDILARTLYGGRASLSVAFVASTLATLIGVAYGLCSGYAGGKLSEVMIRMTDIWVSFPFLVLALAVIAVVGSSPPVLIVLMSLSGWVYAARLTHAQTIKIRQTEYVLSAHALGATPQHIIRYHIIPAIISINIVMWTLTFGTLIIVESSLSFIGLGISPPTPSWGNMLSDSQVYLQDMWWMSVIPGTALMLTVLCVNTVGDTLQKIVDRYMYN